MRNAQLIEPILAYDQLTVASIHARDDARQWSDAVALADTEHARVDVCRAGLQRCVAVRDGAASVVVAVEFDVDTGKFAQRTHQFVYLARRGHAHRVGDAEAVDDAQLVYGQIHAQQICRLAAE